VTASGPVMDLQRMLGAHPGTVTQFLESLTGDSLSAEVISQGPDNAGVGTEAGTGAEARVDLADNRALGPRTGQSLTRRIAVLRGYPSGLPYLYAESAFVPERLPDAVRQQLERTSDPIGRVLVAHALPVAREALPPPGAPPAAGLVTAGPTEVVWARAYRLLIGGAPVFAIREWFFRTVLDALARSAAT
jgi:chorismate-pyruvate lyase